MVPTNQRGFHSPLQSKKAWQPIQVVGTIAEAEHLSVWPEIDHTEVAFKYDEQRKGFDRSESHSHLK